jgi:centrosomal protein CEP290
VLLDEFEDRFNRQFTSWTQEKEAMEAQIEALEKGSGSGGIEPGGSSRPPGSGPYPKWPHGEGGDSEVVAALREELNVMRENEVSLALPCHTVPCCNCARVRGWRNYVICWEG